MKKYIDVPFVCLKAQHKEVERRAKEQKHLALAKGVDPDYIMKPEINPSFVFNKKVLCYVDKKII